MLFAVSIQSSENVFRIPHVFKFAHDRFLTIFLCSQIFLWCKKTRKSRNFHTSLRFFSIAKRNFWSSFPLRREIWVKKMKNAKTFRVSMAIRMSVIYLKAGVTYKSTFSNPVDLRCNVNSREGIKRGRSQDKALWIQELGVKTLIKVRPAMNHMIKA